MKRWFIYAAIGIGVTAALFFGGCESSDSDSSGVDEYFKNNPYESEARTEPDPQQLSISPTLASVSIVGREILFTAKGGNPSYKWSVTDSSKGRVDVVGWSQGRYVCLQVGNNTVRVEDQNGHFALAQITPVTDTMTISPSEVTAEAAETAVVKASFTVNGGSPPYAWSVANPALGTISYSSDTTYQAAYTGVCGAYGINVITVRDADGRTAHATVTQNPEE